MSVSTLEQFNQSKLQMATLNIMGDLVNPTTTSLIILSTKQSTSSSTGSLTVDGGVGIAKDLYVGGNIYSNNNSTTVNGTFSGPWATSHIGSCTLTKNNGIVTLSFSGVSAVITSNLSIGSDSFIPIDFRPSSTVSGIMILNDSIGYVSGYWELASDGSFNAIHPFSAWTIGQSGGLWTTTITYRI